MKKLQEHIIIPILCNELFDPIKSFTDGYWISQSFKEHLLKDIQPFKISNSETLEKSILTECISDEDIMKSLGITSSTLSSKEEILWRMHYLTQQQPNGETGVLVNNGNATIIGYFLCDDGFVRVACASWDSDDSEWICNVRDLDHWPEGHEVLSRIETQNLEKETLKIETFDSLNFTTEQAIKKLNSEGFNLTQKMLNKKYMEKKCNHSFEYSHKEYEPSYSTSFKGVEIYVVLCKKCGIVQKNYLSTLEEEKSQFYKEVFGK